VPYKSGAQAYQDLVAGHVNLMCAETSATLPYVRGGKIKAYAVMAPKRWSAAPEVPTVDEMGLPGLHIAFWHGLWAPKGTSQEAVGKLNRAVVDALADPASRQRLNDIGQEIPPREQQAPRALYDYQKAEIEKWWPLIKAAGIKAE
jgi:tripartite-type tricarboxylate transporter receptor subunit TctC